MKTSQSLDDDTHTVATRESTDNALSAVFCVVGCWLGPSIGPQTWKRAEVTDQINADRAWVYRDDSAVRHCVHVQRHFALARPFATVELWRVFFLEHLSGRGIWSEFSSWCLAGGADPLTGGKFLKDCSSRRSFLPVCLSMQCCDDEQY